MPYIAPSLPPCLRDRRRRCLRAFVLPMVAVATTFSNVGPVAAKSEPWPARPVRIVAPGAPGAIFDTAARQIADKLAPMIGQPVVVENRPGAGGLTAMQHVARSAPDGYTFVVCSFTQLAVNPWMFDKPAYDPVGDFAPVMVLFESPVVLAVRADSPYRTLADVLDAARARPGRIAYGSSGVGQPPHVLMELVEHRAQVNLVHIPYRGGPAAVSGLLAGDVELIFEGSLGLASLVRSGRLRALAVSGPARVAALPDLPTFAEAGIPGIDNSWMGIVAPAGTPAPIIGRMHAALSKILDTPDVRASYEQSGRIRIDSSPEAFAALIGDGLPKWRELVRTAGLKPE